MDSQPPLAAQTDVRVAQSSLGTAAKTEIVPAWVRVLVDSSTNRTADQMYVVGEVPARSQARLEVGLQFALVELRMLEAITLSASALEAEVEKAYLAVRRLAESCARPFPLRFWNLIPRINESMEPEGRSRYIVFNGGRFKALTSWLGNSSAGRWPVPTATGVGYSGRDLKIACLLGALPGDPVENPRQHSSYRYGRQYGPLPPCFARATRIRSGKETLLLIGGTASVKGQHSRHSGSLAGQFTETCSNINSLLEQIFPNKQATTERVPLNHLRAYVREQGHLEECRELMQSRFHGSRMPEVLQMELCRPELLVEMEGVVASSEGERS